MSLLESFKIKLKFYRKKISYKMKNEKKVVKKNLKKFKKVYFGEVTQVHVAGFRDNSLKK